MSSVVLELQREAMNPQARLADVFRKALVVATKLSLDDFRLWVENELNGYAKESPVPAYRQILGELKAYNPYQGWIPVVIQESKVAKRLTHRGIGQPIAELEALCQKDEGILQIPLQHDVLMNLFGDTEEFRLGLIPTLIIDRAQILGILDAVRNELLNWSLSLEKQGIVGDGLTFSQEEVQKAGNITYHIERFTGILGDVTDSQISIGDYASIHNELKEMGVPQAERNELENLLDNLKSSPPDERPTLIKKGLDWLARNSATIGYLSDTIRGWFETLS